MAFINQATQGGSISNWFGLPGKARRDFDLTNTTSSDLDLSTIFKCKDDFHIQSTGSDGDVAASNPANQSETKITPALCDWTGVSSLIQREILPSNPKNFLATAIQTGKNFVSKAFEIATNAFSDHPAVQEDVMKFNGFTVRVFGSLMCFNSLELNPENGSKFRLNLKLKLDWTAYIFSYPVFNVESSHGVWTFTADFGFGETAIVEIRPPSDSEMDAKTVTYTRISKDLLVLEFP